MVKQKEESEFNKSFRKFNKKNNLNINIDLNVYWALEPKEKGKS